MGERLSMPVLAGLGQLELPAFDEDEGDPGDRVTDLGFPSWLRHRLHSHSSSRSTSTQHSSPTSCRSSCEDLACLPLPLQSPQDTLKLELEAAHDEALPGSAPTTEFARQVLRRLSQLEAACEDSRPAQPTSCPHPDSDDDDDQAFAEERLVDEDAGHLLVSGPRCESPVWDSRSASPTGGAAAMATGADIDAGGDGAFLDISCFEDTDIYDVGTGMLGSPARAPAAHPVPLSPTESQVQSTAAGVDHEPRPEADHGPNPEQELELSPAALEEIVRNAGIDARLAAELRAERELELLEERSRRQPSTPGEEHPSSMASAPALADPAQLSIPTPTSPHRRAGPSGPPTISRPAANLPSSASTSANATAPSAPTTAAATSASRRPSWSSGGGAPSSAAQKRPLRLHVYRVGVAEGVVAAARRLAGGDTGAAAWLAELEHALDAAHQLEFALSNGVPVRELHAIVCARLGLPMHPDGLGAETVLAVGGGGGDDTLLAVLDPLREGDPESMQDYDDALAQADYALQLMLRTDACTAGQPRLPTCSLHLAGAVLESVAV